MRPGRPRPRALALASALLSVAACRTPLPPELTAPPPAREALEPEGPAAVARAGKPAPSFELTDREGRIWSSAELAGRAVVLQWFDPECPFLVHAYQHGDLRELSARVSAAGVVWLGVNSSGPGRVGSGRELNARFVREHAVLHPVLLDEDGAVARSFGARRVPEVFLIAPDGTLAYRGPIDNAPFGVVPGGVAIGGERHLYLELAIEALAAGRAPAIPQLDPYGCRLRLAPVLP